MTGNYPLQETDIQHLVNSINRLVGVIESSKKDIVEKHACLETLGKLLSAQKALSTVAKEMIKRGIIQCAEDYNPAELSAVLETMFKFN
jgi:DNA-binding FrmR family transcriptional regulator